MGMSFYGRLAGSIMLQMMILTLSMWLAKMEKTMLNGEAQPGSAGTTSLLELRYQELLNFYPDSNLWLLIAEGSH